MIVCSADFSGSVRCCRLDGSLPLESSCSSATRPRATRLLIVPTAQPQREALILVGAGGFAYEEAAEICGCAVGTIKSRVARGRVALEQLLSSGKLPSRRQHRTDPDKSALQTIMGEVDELSRDHERSGSTE